MDEARHNSVTIIVSVAALVVAAFSALIAWQSRETAQEANDIATEAEMRQAEREQREFAVQVTLSEAPRWIYDIRPPADGNYWAVLNYNNSHITAVWVEDSSGRAIKMWQIPPCSAYTTPPGFEPVVVHFADSNGTWQRRADGGAPTPDGLPLPETDDADAGPDYVIPNCP